MEMKLEEKDAKEWKYRGEGAMNLVLAYAGLSPNFMGKVLRVPKVPCKGSDHERSGPFFSKHELLVWEGTGDFIKSPNKEIAEQLFVQCVMMPLLGREFVDPGICVPVSREFLESVEKNVLSQRPVSRVDVAKVNIFADSVLLMSDHSVFPDSKEEPCISVEIKPKCGFLSNSYYISDKNAFKQKVSRFKMHQFLKLKEHEITELSEYDPPDLFSWSTEKIDKALKALFLTPQNNLRIFLDGTLVYGELGRNTDETKFSDAMKFEYYIDPIIRSKTSSSIASFLNLIREALVYLEVLDRLILVQKLDNFDIEAVIHAYYDVISQPCKVCENNSDDRQSRKRCVHSFPFDERLKMVKDYLIAATAKDCSLMISFRPLPPETDSPYKTVYLDSINQWFECEACFIDLDLKPLEKIEHYYELDQKILNCYRQNIKPEVGAAKGGTIEGYEAGY